MAQGRTTIRYGLTLLGCLLSLCLGSAEVARPNIIYILSDDLAQGDVGCYGQKLIKTPVMDQLAAEGTRYLQAFCGTSVCAPSRNSLLTGMHCGHTAIRANRELQPEGQMPLPAGTLTVAELLRRDGYATACIGKWGLGLPGTTGDPLKNGFEHFYGYNCQRHAHSYFPTYLYNDNQRFSLPGNDGLGVGKTYAQELIQQDVEHWVRSKKDQPFFLYYAVTLPHARQEIDDYGLYKDQPWTPTQKAYAAQVTRLDSDIGRLVKVLKELKLDEKTLIIITGDNGSSFSPTSELGKLFEQASNGLRGYKRDLYEGALRQAAIVRWPGQVPAQQVRNEPWAFWDFLPTALELAGVKPPQDFHCDGLSLASFFRGGPAPQRDYFYWELHEAQTLQAARWSHWKAVRNGPAAKMEIYDMDADPAEKNNLAAQHPELVTRALEIFKEAHTDDPNWPMLTVNDLRKKAAEKAKAK